MIFTVAICTWNRADSLRKTLESLTRATPPSAPWEVLVVNNNSTDHTVAVLKEFENLLPLRSIIETRQGLSHARNAAVIEAKGEFMLWTDDDVLVDTNWLIGYEQAILKWPEASVFGGPIQPLFEGDPPAWLSEGWRLIADAFAYRNLGDESVPLQPWDSLPYGANYAVRTAAQRGQRYDPDLGRSGNAGALGEEVSVLVALLAAGPGWWIPTAVVFHRIPAHRQTMRYVGQFYRMVGKTHAMIEDHPDTPLLFGLRRWAIRDVMRSSMRFLYGRASRGGVASWLPAYSKVHFAIGSLRPTVRTEGR
ncbi:MAG: glycosyltransferase [Burkholderiaceae bacterium]|jgi:glycosyltransferase involved in cell wall biosynthesis